jgi:hypothetical protein
VFFSAGGWQTAWVIVESVTQSPPLQSRDDMHCCRQRPMAQMSGDVQSLLSAHACSWAAFVPTSFELHAGATSATIDATKSTK